ncbi:glycosyl transferase group 1 [Stanieria cyanosphaera PCC 7437]|uniref:Glycosyl transferase group 1 n=1 Tax=Stanieria cyanosphaera (strain ATCC 29371 / PCC 7437) TaxID=111780 RepID=K9XSI0_STAC7|nr:glycosyltransferase family 4 protein [Stanieria cyanosphaera]AFZ35026.1 glycosyl transferase group 1 [Stanieria cyanosphaera PCC 7437]
MKVLLINHSDLAGGAARAAYRLHQGLKQLSVDSQMLVQQKLSDDRAVFAPTNRLETSIGNSRIAVDALPLKFYPQRHDVTYSLQWLPDRTLAKINQLTPEVINLHWIGEALLQIETIAKLARPIVWTLHDMWAFTGGCHYNQNCDRYKLSCGSCPQLGSNSNWDLSRWVWQRKAKAWQQLDVTIIALSSWLRDCAASSSLFQNCRIELIPNGIDLEVYRPIDQKFARKLLRLPEDKQLILFGSLGATSDTRKGFHLLQPALHQLEQLGWQDIELVIFGASRPQNPPKFGFKTHYLGILKDDLSLALAYSAADVFVLPSTQDNLPNTVLEAIACGTPAVGFNIGGMPDLIEHQQNGYLAKPNQIEDLAQGLIWILENESRRQKLSGRARQKAEQEFSLQLQAQRYVNLFQELVLTHQKRFQYN